MNALLYGGPLDGASYALPDAMGVPHQLHFPVTPTFDINFKADPGDLLPENPLALTKHTYALDRDANWAPVRSGDAYRYTYKGLER